MEKDTEEQEKSAEEGGREENKLQEEIKPQKNVPSREECISLLKEVGAQEELIEHGKAVADLALKMCEMYDLHHHEKRCNTALVEAGALLHDIGRVKTHDIAHNIQGSKILREKGYPEELCLIVERHIGAGVDVNEAEKFGLPRRNYIPQRVEEKIVAHADNLIDGTKRIKVQDLIRKLVDKEELKIASRIIRLHNKLSKLCGIEIDEIE